MTQPRDTADVINTRGTAAIVNTGTAAGEVPLNSDLPTFGTAATAVVQTTPTDTTAGALLNNETTSIGGQVNYTAANLNTDVFGNFGSTAMVGVAISTTTARLFGPLSSFSDPLSITVSGDFVVRRATGGVVTGGSTVVPAIQPTLTGPKLIALDVAGLSGMTIGEFIELRCNGNSTITVNYS